MKKYLTFAFFILLFALSFWLMFHTLSYDSQAGDILVGGKYWSDFGATIPLIRSFSLGTNWPLEHPLYPGSPIRYHFLFYALVGLLEKSGLRLDLVLNIPSILGLFFLILMIYALAKQVFHKTSVALLSVLFFIFNASFSWLDYLKQNDFILKSSIINLKSLSHFPAFAPWNSSSITAFWNLNIYSNQRHLAPSFTVALTIIYILYTSPRRLTYLVGFLLGLLLLLNQAAFAMAAVFCLWYFIFKARIRLLLSLLGFLPWLLVTLIYTHHPSLPIFQPGFLHPLPITALSFIKYWFLNFGPHLVLIPAGFILAPRRAKILGFPLLMLFVLPNLFRFSTDMVNNHKFFNFFLIMSGMFSSYLLIRLKPLILLVPLLFLGGIVDFFPVLNDDYYHLSDYPKNQDVKYFIQNTPPDALVLNSTWFYHPASLAGRKIFNGYSYFTWSYGYDQVTREQMAITIYRAVTKSEACGLLVGNNISYVELNPRPENFIQPNFPLWQTQFTPSYTNPASGLAVYSVNQNCHEI